MVWLLSWIALHIDPEGIKGFWINTRVSAIHDPDPHSQLLAILDFQGHSCVIYAYISPIQIQIQIKSHAFLCQTASSMSIDWQTPVAADKRPNIL